MRCIGRTAHLTALAFAMLASAATAQGQDKRVTREQSKITLDIPTLKGGRDFYQEFGWNSDFSVATSYASVLAPSSNFPRAQVYLVRLAPNRYWVPVTLDEAWLRGFAPFFKERTIRLVRGATGADDKETKSAIFDVGGAQCIGFERKSYGRSRSENVNLGSSGLRGVYCAAPGEPVDDGTLAMVLGGISASGP